MPAPIIPPAGPAQGDLPMTAARVIETESTLALTRPASLRLLELMESQTPGDEELRQV